MCEYVCVHTYAGFISVLCGQPSSQSRFSANGADHQSAQDAYDGDLP